MSVSWRRNFYTLWVTEICVIVGLQAVQPFLPFYIQYLGVQELSQALIWSGRMGTAAGFAMALSAPFWGNLADRVGRKPMVVRSMLGGGLAIVLMIYAQTVEQLLLVRVLHGFLSGTVTACMTIVSTTTPRPHLGFALGMMQGGFMLGASVGPYLGGVLIDRFGYHPTFLGAATVAVLAGLAVQLWVREEFSREATKNGDRGGVVRDARRLLAIPSFRVLAVSFCIIQFSFAAGFPVVPLFLQQLAGGGNVVSMAGLIFAVSGIVGALASVVMGKWSEDLGLARVLTGGLICCSVVVAAQGIAGNVPQLASLVVLGGFFGGLIRPVGNVLVTRYVPDADRGKAFGVLGSATALGWAPGPAFGGFVAAEYGFHVVFLISAALMFAVAVGFWRTMSLELQPGPHQGKESG